MTYRVSTRALTDHAVKSTCNGGELRYTVLGGFAQSKFLGNLADQAGAEGFLGAPMARHEVERLPLGVPSGQPPGLAVVRLPADQGDGGLGLPHDCAFLPPTIR